MIVSGPVGESVQVMYKYKVRACFSSLRDFEVTPVAVRVAANPQVPPALAEEVAERPANGGERKVRPRNVFRSYKLCLKAFDASAVRISSGRSCTT